jgi:putative ABC transport system permease protein
MPGVGRLPRLLSLAGDVWLEAVRAAFSHRLRSSLAALAMAAAVATIAVVVTGLDGVARYARLTSARTFGSDTFVVAQVVSGQLSRRELAERLARNPPITRADVRFLTRVAGEDVLYAPTAQRTADASSGARRFEDAAINGTASTLIDIRALDIGEGRFFTADEDRRAAQVAVIGADVAETLFPARSPLGGAIRIGGKRFGVVGVLSRQGTAGGVTLDRYVYLPIAAYERTFGAPATLQVFARAREAAIVDDRTTLEAQERARVGMRARRQLRPGRADTFDVLTPEAARSFVLNLSQRIGAAAPSISLMALVAAMVVVANTALVSVTQRTREIGVRRALGATRRRIVGEVVVESSLTALAGGAVGLAAAFGVLTLASGPLGVPLPLTAGTTAASLGAAGLAGVAAGWLPARRAAEVDVIAALRLE